MAVYTRKELAEKTGCGFDALRYYVSRGVMPPPPRGVNNYRLYGEDAVVIDRRIVDLGKMEKMLVAAKAALNCRDCESIASYIDLAPYTKP